MQLFHVVKESDGFHDCTHTNRGIERTVGRRPLELYIHPAEPFLPDVRVAGRCRLGNDTVAGPRQGVVGKQAADAVLATCLLVADKRKGCRKFRAGIDEHLACGKDGSTAALHVGRSPAIYVLVIDYPGKRVVLPPGARGRYHVNMPAEEEVVYGPVVTRLSWPSGVPMTRDCMPIPSRNERMYSIQSDVQSGGFSLLIATRSEQIRLTCMTVAPVSLLRTIVPEKCGERGLFVQAF